jgi:hypothetical protein
LPLAMVLGKKNGLDLERKELCNDGCEDMSGCDLGWALKLYL